MDMSPALTETEGQFDVFVNVKGGGLASTGAVRHGITRALIALDESHRPVLKAVASNSHARRKNVRNTVHRARRRFQP